MTSRSVIIMTAVLLNVLLGSIISAGHAAEFSDEPFGLSCRREAAFAASGIAAMIAGNYALSNMTAPSFESLKKSGVNPFDRFAAGYYSKNSSRISDMTRDASLALLVVSYIPLLKAPDGIRYGSIATDVVMYIEAAALLKGLTEAAKGGFSRPRPFVYNNDLPDSKRQKDDSFQSFWSGHTSLAFMTAVFTGYVFGYRNPGSCWVKPVWMTGLSLGAATGIVRVRSGNHFPSDILAGAAAGSCIGWIVPRLHRSGNDAVTIIPYGPGGGVCLSLSF